jgi:hypothetical protein
MKPQAFPLYAVDQDQNAYVVIGWIPPGLSYTAGVVRPILAPLDSPGLVRVEMEPARELQYGTERPAAKPLPRPPSRAVDAPTEIIHLPPNAGHTW